MKTSKRILLAFVAILSINSIIAQEEPASKISIDLGADITSRYIWRGIQFSEAPAIQPWAELTAGNFTLGVWGSYETGGEVFGQELDFYASYSLGAVSLTMTDYTFPLDAAAHDDHDDDESDLGTDHFGELSLSFDGVEGFPVTAMVGMFVYGDDHNSFYTEVGYPFSVDQVSLNIFAAAGDGDYTEDGGFELNSIGICASKTLKVNANYSIGAKVCVLYNPDRDQSFLTFTMAL